MVGAAVDGYDFTDPEGRRLIGCETGGYAVEMRQNTDVRDLPDARRVEKLRPLVDKFDEWAAKNFPPGQHNAPLTEHERGVITTYLLWFSKGCPP